MGRIQMGNIKPQIVRFENVTKVYENGDKALANVSFDIRVGDFVFCIGESGAGKSTIIKCILGEETPSIGSIFINDKRLSELSKMEMVLNRRNIGVIFQDFRLIEDMTVFQNVALTLRIAGRRERDIQKQVSYILSLLKLSDKFNYYPKQLSGGQQQKVCLARAIVNRPQILLADEPTGNLDERSAYELMELLKMINAQGTTVLMVTHMHELIDTIAANKIICLDQGKIVPNSQIYTRQTYSYQ